jgi:hypothetical protein
MTSPVSMNFQSEDSVNNDGQHLLKKLLAESKSEYQSLKKSSESQKKL